MIGKRLFLDTSVIIDFLRQQNKNRTWFYFLAESENKLEISIITHTELYSGKRIWANVQDRKELENLIDGMEIINLNRTISELGGQLRAKRGIDLADAIIAATAMNEKIELATLNPKHFKKIPGLHLLKPVLKYKN